jgi:hypothetical protein
MVVAAPNTPVTGFHVVEVRKSINPNFPIASEDSLTSTTTMPIIKMITVKDAAAVRERKRSSGIFFLRGIANARPFLLVHIINQEKKRVRYVPDPYWLRRSIALQRVY